MKIVIIPAQRVLGITRELTLAETGAFVTEATALLEDQAERSGFTYAGPWTFVSHNLPQDAETPFTLKICRPIRDGVTAPAPLTVETLPPLRCATLEYEGPLSGIYAGGYAPLLTEVLESGTPLTGEIREVYHVRDLPESPVNQVEIQIGLVENVEA